MAKIKFSVARESAEKLNSKYEELLAKQKAGKVKNLKVNNEITVLPKIKLGSVTLPKQKLHVYISYDEVKSKTSCIVDVRNKKFSPQETLKRHILAVIYNVKFISV